MKQNLESQRKELLGLLSEDVQTTRMRAQSTFDKVSEPFNTRLILFGAGNLGRKTLRGLRASGIEPLGFADNNPALWGTLIEELPVYSPAIAAEKYRDSAAFVMTVWRGEGTDTMAERCEPLLKLGCSKVLNFGHVFWKYPESFLPHYSFDLPHNVIEQSERVLAAFDLWADDDSRDEFVAQIRWRLNLDFDGLPRPVKHEIYFPFDLFELNDEEVFVDCGAFDGDTLASFLRNFKSSFRKYIAIEADPTNFANLEKSVSSLPPALAGKISTHQLAVGAKREKVRFSATGTESAAVGHGTLEIESAPLDEILAGEPVTWIKMDIEGSEPDALIGARQTIMKNMPVLAICVYHQQNHLWEIPLMIKAMSSDYHFFLRPHLLESWDLVLYAIPDKRLRRDRQN